MDEATSNPTREIGSSNSAHVSSLQNQESQSQGTHTTSDVWHHYTKLNWDDKPNRKDSCKYCGKQLKFTHGTSSLIRHLERCKVYPYRKFNTTQRTPRFQLTQEGAINLSLVFVPPPYDQATSRTKLARMIIIDELSFRHVEHEGFRDFVYSLRPEFPIPSRVTVAKDCFKLWLTEREKLKNYFKQSKVRVCLTTDIWASKHHLDYMCLTAHFIDDNWNLQKRILNFTCISSHTGATIGSTIETNLIDWGIEKVLTITVDNASSNDVGMQYLKKRFINWKENVLNGEFLHMRCCAHILSLIVKDGMKEVDDSIYRVRSAVRFVRSSTSRLQRFKACVHEEKLDSKKLVCLDVETRWNSTYLMLQSAVVFQKAFQRLEEKDSVFRSELQKLKGTPLETGWVYVKSLLPFLKSFYDVTLKVSSSLYVTCNEFFHLVFGIGAMLNDLVNSTNESTKFMSQRMKLKNDKYWGNIDNMNHLLFIAVVLDPLYKLQYVKFGLELVYEKQKVKELLMRVNVSLDALFSYYLVIGGNGGIGTSRSGENALLNDEIESDKSIEEYLKGRYKRQKLVEEAEELSKSELDRYLEAKCVNQDEENFDILAWWKRNSSDYPILGLMAKDILAVQVSTVASESAFSTGGRVLDAFRSSLTPKVVESLICAQNWLRSSTHPIEIEEKFEEIEALEEELNKLGLNDTTIVEP